MVRAPPSTRRQGRRTLPRSQVQTVADDLRFSALRVLPDGRSISVVAEFEGRFVPRDTGGPRGAGILDVARASVDTLDAQGGFDYLPSDHGPIHFDVKMSPAFRPVFTREELDAVETIWSERNESFLAVRIADDPVDRDAWFEDWRPAGEN
jgi:hypothetical protein